MAERLSAVTGYRRRKCSLFSGTADPILLPNPHSVRKREWVHVVAYLHGVCVGIRGEPDKGVKSVAASTPALCVRASSPKMCSILNIQWPTLVLGFLSYIALAYFSSTQTSVVSNDGKTPTVTTKGPNGPGQTVEANTTDVRQ
jgi:hypothetical protein